MSDKSKYSRFTLQAATNMADWHDSCVTSLGAVTNRNEVFWQHDRPVNEIFMTAISLGGPSSRDAQKLAVDHLLETYDGNEISIWDSFNSLDLADRGFSQDFVGTWTVRHPSPRPVGSTNDELQVVQITTPADLAAWERAEQLGFGGDVPKKPHQRYGKDIVDDPRIRFFAGVVNDEIVSGSMAYVGASSVGMYGVFTLPEHRRRGYGQELAWAATLAEPELAVTTEPSEEAGDLYGRMGFSPIGGYSAWSIERPQ